MPGDTIEISKIKDKEKYNSNFDSIDWGNLKDKPIEKKTQTKKHVTAGLCGEFGMSTFDEKAYKANYDLICKCSVGKKYCEIHQGDESDESAEV